METVNNLNDVWSVERKEWEMNNASYAQCHIWMWSMPDPANNPEILEGQMKRNKFSPKN